MSYILHIESGVPEFFKVLYEELLNDLDNNVSKYNQSCIIFIKDCCQDSVEIQIKDIKAIRFFKDFIKIDFNKCDFWLCWYSDIEDVLVEENLLDDKQLTFDDF